MLNTDNGCGGKQTKPRSNLGCLVTGVQNIIKNKRT